MSSDPQSDRAAWDAFIDALDRAGQAGSAAAVEVPPIAGVISAGKQFGDLTGPEIQHMSRVAASLGRRADVVATMWRDLQWKRKQQRKADKESNKESRKAPRAQ
jgi:hypothetical protein